MSEPATLSAAKPTPAKWRRRTLIATLLAAALAAAVVARAWYRAVPHAVRRTSLEGSRLTGAAWRNLPFDLTPQEAADVQQCLQLAQGRFATTDHVTAFEADSTRQSLEALLARRPNFFYAEWLLGAWHAMHGDALRSRQYKAAAMSHAPVVLIQPYHFADGRPLVGATISRMEIEHNRVKNHSLDPSLALAFFDLTTDLQGRIAVPAYDTVYRVASVSYPNGYQCAYPSLGWFEARSKLALLPDATVSVEKR